MYDFPIEDLFRAYLDARSNKRNTAGQLKFEMNLEENIVSLYNDLVSGTYQIGTSVCFIVEDSVKREIFAADFRDRIVLHHLVYNYISPVFEKLFICDSYSCRKGKGTLYGVKRLSHNIRSCSLNYTRDCYILKLDIKGYFIGIDRTLLLKKVENTIYKYLTERKELVLWLCRNIITYEPTVNCRMKSKYGKWDDLPKSKSLFYCNGDYGLPIGNLTSQLFSNIYLNELDQWIKREKKIKYYGRYVDDFYIIHTDKKRLQNLVPEIRDFLLTRLHLYLHPDKVYLQHYSKGVPFLGAIVKPHCIMVGKRTKNNAHKCFRKIESDTIKVFADSAPQIEYIRLLRSKVNSYLGHMRHYNTYRLTKTLIRKYGSLYCYGYYTGKRNIRKFVLFRRYTTSAIVLMDNC